MLQKSAISTKFTNWDWTVPTGWSPSWPLVRDIGVPSPRRVPVVNFTLLGAQLVGLLRFAATWLQQRPAEGDSAQQSHSGAHGQDQCGQQQQEEHPHVPLSPWPPQPHHKGTTCTRRAPFCAQLLFHTAWGRKQNTKRGLCSTLDLSLTERLPGGEAKWNPRDWTTFPFKHMEIKH